MGGNVDFNTQRAGTGRLGSLTGNLDPAAAQAAAAAPADAPVADPTQKKAKTDTLKLSPDTQVATAGMNVANVADLAKTVGAVQSEQKQVTDLKARINALVPGGVNFQTQDGGNWSSHDLKNLFDVVDAMSPNDRQVLSGINLVRSGQVQMNAAGDSSVAGKMGKDIADAASLGAAGVSDVQGDSKPKGFVGHLKDFVLHSAEKMEGIPILRYFGEKLVNMFGQQAPERAVVVGDTGKLISKEVWAHEIGHQVQMVNRGWNPDKIAEFSKLSKWTETDSNGQSFAADGVDHQTGERLEFDANRLKPEKTDNFASKYAMTGPAEDFAETYRTFVLDPKSLMQEAPDKFLYLNAQSQKYSTADVKGFAQQTGTDLNSVATQLVLNSGLKQDTLNSIMTVNGVSPDKSAIVSDAATKIGSGDPLSQAWAKVTTLAKDPTGAQQVLSDPQTALGDTWAKLSPEEQSLFKDPSFMQAQLGELQRGYASAESSSDATQTQLYRQGIATLMNRMMTDPAFQQQLAQNPGQALKDAKLTDQLPKDVVQAFTNNPGAVKALVDQVASLMNNASADQKAKYQANLEKAIPQLSPEAFEAFASALNNQKDPSLAAKEVGQALQTGSIIYQGGGDPPCI